MLIPPKFRQLLIADVHNLGRMGVKRCCRELRKNAFWPGMYQEVDEFVSSCTKCLQFKLRPPDSYPSYHIKCTERWRVLHMDIVGPFPQSNNRNEYVLTMIDRFTRWVCLVPLSSITSYDVSTALFTKWICQFGLPEIIITDQGSQFDGEIFTTVCAFFGIEKRRTTAWISRAHARNNEANNLYESLTVR